VSAVPLIKHVVRSQSENRWETNNAINIGNICRLVLLKITNIGNICRLVPLKIF
jgi:hypothetical protein